MRRNDHDACVSHLRHNLRCSVILLVFGTFIFSPLLNSRGQQISIKTFELDRGIKLYDQEEFRAASDALQAAVKRRKDDITAWHYLGLTLAKLGKLDDARKAHEKAARIADTFLDQMFTVPKAQLLEAAESAEQFVALSDNLSTKKLQEWRDRISYLRVSASENVDFKAYGDKEVDTRVRILSKPEPVYTEEARRNQVRGTVVLRCVFTADGHVRFIQVVSGLPDGLNQNAVSAARHIRFIPATKDGNPVSMYMQLEYNFNLY